MKRYETLFLVVPEITDDETRAIETQFDKVIQEGQGQVISIDRWGKYRLAYPVRKYEYGIYYLARFEINEEQKEKLLEAVHALFAVRHVDLVMRYTLVKLDAKGSLDYIRPESLEETPTRDVETFLKENKMSGFLSKTGAAAHTDHDMSEPEDDTREFYK